MKTKYLILTIPLLIPTFSFSMGAIVELSETAYSVYNAYRGAEAISSAIETYHHYDEAHANNHQFTPSSSQCDWQTVRDVTTYNGSNFNIDRNSFLDSRVDHSTATTSGTNEGASALIELASNTSHHAESASDTYSASAFPSHQQASHIIETTLSEFTEKNIPEQQSNLTNNASSISAFDVYQYRDSAFDNRLVVDMESPAAAPTESGRLIARETDSLRTIQHGENRQSELGTMQKIISLSDNFETIALQIGASLQTSGVRFPAEVNIELRKFFFDNKGHFKPINTKERLEEAAQIVAPGIKEYFIRTNNPQGYIPFLKESVAQKIPGFELILKRELGDVGLADYFSRAGSSVSAFFYDRIHGPTHGMHVREGPFVTHLARIITLCKANNFTEAKKYIGELVKTGMSSENGTEVAKSAEDNYCIMKTYDEFYHKAQQQQASLKSQPQVKDTSLQNVAPQALQQENTAAITATSNTSSIVTTVEYKEQPYAKADGNNESQRQNPPLPTEFVEATPPDPNHNLKPEEPQKEKPEIEIKTSLRESKTFKDAQNYVNANVEEFKKLNLEPISNKSLKHIVNEHSTDGVKGIRSQKSIFRENENFVDLALQGWKDGHFIDERTKIFDVGRHIGFTEQGNSTSTIKVILNESKNSIKSVFPV